MTLQHDATAACGRGRVAISVRGLGKQFGGTRALDRVDVDVAAGSIHALLGGNGSGKSTLIKCLAGVHPADTGTVSIHGRLIQASGITPRIAAEANLRFVHQDLALFDTMSIAENFALGSGFPTTALNTIRWRSLRDRVGELLDVYGIGAQPTDLVGTLRPSEKTMVAIARALADQRGGEYTLVLDEPTASLPEDETRELMTALRRRADQGQTIVLVTHRFREVEEVADHITVFRDGFVAGTGPAREMHMERVVEMMSGLRPGAPGTVPAVNVETKRRQHQGEPLLEIRKMAVGPDSAVALTVGRGEIVGLAGLAGSGRSRILRSIFGDIPATGGSMILNGKPYAPSSPRGAMARGIGMVPENRPRDAAFLDLSVRENSSISVLGNYWKKCFINRQAEQAATRALIAEHSIRAGGTDSPVSALSGGNQQKVIMARWMQRRPDLLLLDEPTQGVDVMSRREIYASLEQLVSRGAGVLLASSDLDELVDACDRILVLRNGKITGEFTPGSMDRNQLAAMVMSEDTGRKSTITEGE